MSKEKCILCDQEARVENVSGKDTNFVRCDTCGKYYLVEPSESVRYYREEVPREERAMLSAYTREKSELGEEPPELRYPHALEDVISKYEGKSLDEKVENLIWYLKKESKEYGSSVRWDIKKDYPVTYSLGPQGSDKIVHLASDKGLLTMVSRDSLKLTEEGWELGSKLMKEKESS